MAEVIDEAVAADVPQPVIVAGLYDSIVQNYLNRVKGSRSVGQVIFCQGMPFAADALAAAVARRPGAKSSCRRTPARWRARHRVVGAAGVRDGHRISPASGLLQGDADAEFGQRLSPELEAGLPVAASMTAETTLWPAGGLARNGGHRPPLQIPSERCVIPLAREAQGSSRRRRQADDPERFLAARVEAKDTFHCKAAVGCGGAGNCCRIERLRTVVAGQRQAFTWAAVARCTTRARGKGNCRPRQTIREREELVREIVAKLSAGRTGACHSTSSGPRACRGVAGPLRSTPAGRRAAALQLVAWR